MTEEPSYRKILWRHYNLINEAYQFYLGILIRSSVFLFVITGAIFTICIFNPELSAMRWLLVIPSLIGLSFCGIRVLGAKTSNGLIKESKRILEALNLEHGPNIVVLKIALIMG